MCWADCTCQDTFGLMRLQCLILDNPDIFWHLIVSDGQLVCNAVSGAQCSLLRYSGALQWVTLRFPSDNNIAWPQSALRAITDSTHSVIEGELVPSQQKLSLFWWIIISSTPGTVAPWLESSLIYSVSALHQSTQVEANTGENWDNKELTTFLQNIENYREFVTPKHW